MCKEDCRNEIQRVLAEQMNQKATSLEEVLGAKHALAVSDAELGNTGPARLSKLPCVSSEKTTCLHFARRHVR
jgi:hypothetical protein